MVRAVWMASPSCSCFTWAVLSLRDLLQPTLEQPSAISNIDDYYHTSRSVYILGYRDNAERNYHSLWAVDKSVLIFHCWTSKLRTYCLQHSHLPSNRERFESLLLHTFVGQFFLQFPLHSAGNGLNLSLPHLMMSTTCFLLRTAAPEDIPPISDLLHID